MLSRTHQVELPMITRDPWITATGQRWKLIITYLLTAQLAIIVLGGLFSAIGPLVSTNEDLMSLLSIPSGAVTLAWIALAVKCPHCGTRTGWWCMQNRGVTRWFTAFVATQHCPVCGHDSKGVR
jgi:hypothetical protein